MDGAPPFVPNYVRDPQWRWQWWKFNLDPDILFTELANKYNTAPCRIQCQEAFHADVSSIIIEAEDVEDFHRRLKARRDDRLREIQEAWYSGSAVANYQPNIWRENTKLWQAFLHLSSQLSFDAIVRFIDALIPDADRDFSLRMGSLDPTPPVIPTVPPTVPEQEPNDDQRPKTRSRQSPRTNCSPTEKPNLDGSAQNDCRLNEASQHKKEQGNKQEQEPEDKTRNQSTTTAKKVRATERVKSLHNKRKSSLGNTLTKNSGVGRNRHPTSRQHRETRPRISTDRTRTSRRLAGLLPELDTVP